MPTRRKMVLAVAGIIATTGCGQTIDKLPGEGGTSPDLPGEGGTSPDFRTVSVENKRNQSVSVKIIVNASEERVHSKTYELGEDEKKLVYNSSSDNLGSTSLEVTARTDSYNTTSGNSGCDGHLPVIIEPDGSLSSYNAVC